MSETMNGMPRFQKAGIPDLSVIIAARNEEAYIGPCLEALLAQDDTLSVVEVIVAANACTDGTVENALSYGDGFVARGWTISVIEVPTPGKVNALNAGNAVAKAPVLVFLDADVICDPELLGQTHAALAPDRPLYATGTLAVAPAQSRVTRLYARIWQELPFIKSGAVGAGYFAVNAQGRARWDEFPQITSDDTFVRLNFSPDERIEVPARYHWPMIEGFSRLVRIRRRQKAGMTKMRALYPELMANEGKAELGNGQLLQLALKHPVAFMVYATVHIAVRMKKPEKQWVGGR